MQNIIIVESPSKSKTIGSYVGKGYLVLSSKGHICDLATSGKDGLGIDIEHDFKPNYKVMKDKEELVEYLKTTCEGRQVYLATDPDREGEAIAYHLARTLNLNLDDLNRIEFHEITKPAVRKALENPHRIDMQMVNSQECRRMIDRILGFKLSKLLQKKIGSKSAGRVQSVVLKLIVDLEKEILAFIPTPYYEMEANFNTFKLKLVELDGMPVDSKNRILDRKVLETLQPKLMSFFVSNIANKLVNRNSYPAFTTSTLQQDASNKLGFSPSRTMRIAQGLYEGKAIKDETVGLITYMRTDSTRLSDLFVDAAHQYIRNTYGDKYLGEVKIKTAKNMQDAHEGIRPTAVERTPEAMKPYLTEEEYQLYRLIYNRTIASLMAPARFNSLKVEFTNTNSLWAVTGQTMEFDGYLKAYGKTEEDENTILPNFSLGEGYNANEIVILDKKTAPKARYTEASIIKEMEALGIGRPSTYAQTILTLKERNYITVEKKCLVPTEQGTLTSEKLDQFFNDLINVSYTAEMETNLDEIARGTKKELEQLKEFYQAFIPLFDIAMEKMEAIYPIPTEQICPECGGMLVIRKSKFGEFISCSNYPSCKYVYKEENQENEPVDTGIICPECGKGHIVERVAKTGKNKGAIFYACNNYPACKVTYSDPPTNHICPNCGSIMLEDKDGKLYCSKQCDKKVEKEETILCPVCKKGHMVKRVASKGKNKGNVFYGCSNFPRCKNIMTEEDIQKLS
ncbi:MAG: type I DNA topoisomerase [Anaeroplasmataceae bacterium]|nr:type I DNA topoisomerase [Anaeroplasmataceae bacterium]